MLFKKDNLFTRNPLGCVGFVCLALLGALIGRAVFSHVYERPALALLSTHSALARPEFNGASVLLSAFLPCASYCSIQVVAGFRRAFLPFWAAAALSCGIGWGMQLGLANALLLSEHAGVALLLLMLPILLTAPLYLYVALLPLTGLKNLSEPAAPDAAKRVLLTALPSSTMLLALQTLLSTLASTFGMRMLFD